MTCCLPRTGRHVRLPADGLQRHQHVADPAGAVRGRSCSLGLRHGATQSGLPGHDRQTALKLLPRLSQVPGAAADPGGCGGEGEDKGVGGGGGQYCSDSWLWERCT